MKATSMGCPLSGHMFRRGAILAAVLLGVIVSTGAAQDNRLPEAMVQASAIRMRDAVRQVPRAPVTQVPQSVNDPIGFRGFIAFDRNAMYAAESFNAAFDKSSFSVTGFGGEVINVYRRLFLRLAISSMEETGEPRSTDNATPLTLKLRPLEIGGGWRLRAVANGRVVPYVGGGLLRMSYDETSGFAGSRENISESFMGSNVFGGVEVRVAPWIIAGVEGQYRHVANALGDGGVSVEVGENNLGGTTFRILIGVGR